MDQHFGIYDYEIHILQVKISINVHYGEYSIKIAIKYLAIRGDLWIFHVMGSRELIMVSFPMQMTRHEFHLY